MALYQELKCYDVTAVMCTLETLGRLVKATTFFMFVENIER